MSLSNIKHIVLVSISSLLVPVLVLAPTSAFFIAHAT